MDIAGAKIHTTLQLQKVIIASTNDIGTILVTNILPTIGSCGEAAPGFLIHNVVHHSLAYQLYTYPFSSIMFY